MLPACLALVFLSVPVWAQSSGASADDKDAQIASLKAEVERLKAALHQGPSADTPAQAAAPSRSAQQSASKKSGGDATGAAPASEDNSLLHLTKFEVRSTQGVGYSQGNSASALKTSEPLMRLPAQIIVVTSDMIKDIGSHFASDILSYAGLVPYYRGPAILSRGSRIGNPYIDDVPQATGIGLSDNTNIDTYQVIKGPQQVLYPLASLGGLVIETTKKPLPGVTQGIFDARVSQWGRHTFTFDINQPLATVDDAKFTARLVGIEQSGQGAFYNSKDDKRGIFPSLSLDWKNTIVQLQFDHEVFHYLPGGTGILTPDGNVYTGLGVRNQNSPPGNADTNTQNDARFSWTQIVSENWQVKSQATFFNVKRLGSVAFPTTVNWNNNTMTYTLRKDNGFNEALDVQTDVSGQYNIKSIPMRTAFGFNLHDQTIKSEFWVKPTVTIPIGDAAAINNLVLPPIDSYTPPANPGSRTKQYVSNAYFMQTADVIPNWLTLVGGFTYSNIETIADTNLALRNPFTATDSNAHQYLHRFGAVAYLTKSITAYVSQSTTFNPAVGVTYDNSPLPSVLGKSEEAGLKASFWDGKLSASVAAYKMELTNQAILAPFPALNVAGLNYYIPIGTTNSRGWDASLTLAPLPGLQIVATGYMGTVHDQNGNPITATVENSWSTFGRYDFSKDSPLKGLAVGGGATKAGGKWFNMGGLVLPNGAALPTNSSGNALFKLKQDVLVNLFAGYRLNRHWNFRIDCQNVLDKVYPIGAQGVGLVDAVEPRSFSFQTTYRY
ncbi:TonB-dependent receptor [Opitutus sp. GAS368]|uniref:TonB-dependent siderophore receptor n=1 Tax=Opitutus sp. GAS368 TaxID=1882749 RepID=UPI00087C5B75|nr:TonB-dependent receptor [Opitutus sp. GAS368]SDS49336.1 Outer membrane receptor for ferric coprogen and ferric-rhodotorulic acid [Opitutus sp. GAS368]